MGIFKRQSVIPREVRIQTDHRETDFETENLIYYFSYALLLGVAIDVRFRDKFLELYRTCELLCECLVPEKECQSVFLCLLMLNRQLPDHVLGSCNRYFGFGCWHQFCRDRWAWQWPLQATGQTGIWFSRLLRFWVNKLWILKPSHKIMRQVRVLFVS